jgi:predicted DNA-binding transcriptional regulator AlpA
MINPFDTITERLDNLEGLVRATLCEREAKAQPEHPDIGGLDLAEAITGLSRGTLYKLTCTRAIPHHKKGGKLYFFRDELLAWIREGNRPTVEQLSTSTKK